MPNPLNPLKSFSPHFSRMKKFRSNSLSLLVSLSTLLTLGSTSAIAATPDTAPPELKNTISQIDAAANSRNVEGVMQFYSPNFTHADGLNRQSMEKTLTTLWQRYPQLRYSTQLQSWQAQGNAIVAETVTQITGTSPVQGRDWTFNSTIRSRQRYEGQKIVSQEILSERTLLTSGEKPPTVDLTLPQQVRVGQEYPLDAIVREPLGDDMLVGATLEEAVKADKYLESAAVELEDLNAGGIFKVGRAAATEGKYWISAVLIRHDGITAITQRLPVVNNNNRPSR